VSGRHIDVHALETRDLKNEPSVRRVNVGVVGRLSDVAQSKCALTDTVQEKCHEGSRGRLAFGARDGDDVGSIGVVEPQIQRRRDDNATSLQVQHVTATTRNARTFQDDVAASQCIEATFGRNEYVVTETVCIVNEDEGSGHVRETTLRRATFDAVAKDADPFAGEVSEASGSEHGSVLVE
jgi:hypothetical protein